MKGEKSLREQSPDPLSLISILGVCMHAGPHHWLSSTFCQGGVLARSLMATMSSSSRSENSESESGDRPALLLAAALPSLRPTQERGEALTIFGSRKETSKTLNPAAKRQPFPTNDTAMQ